MSRAFWARGPDLARSEQSRKPLTAGRDGTASDGTASQLKRDERRARRARGCNLRGTWWSRRVGPPGPQPGAGGAGLWRRAAPPLDL